MKKTYLFISLGLVALWLATAAECSASGPDTAPSQRVAFAAEQGDVTLTAEPRQGWQFYGWARDNNGNGQRDADEPILSLSEKYTGCLTPQGNYDKKEKAEADKASAAATDVYIAVYTAAKAQFAPPQQQGGIGLMGSIATSKPVNKPGDTVTFTAIPFEGHTFVKWTDASGKSVSTKPTLTVTPRGGELFTAIFK